MGPDQTPAQRKCATCARIVDSGWRFCAYCGEGVLAPDDALTARTISKIDSQLAARLKEQPGIVREVADSAEDVFTKRFRNYLVLITAFIGILGFIGYKSVFDVFNGFKPVLDEADKRTKRINLNTITAEKKIQVVGNALDKVSLAAADQSKRVIERDGEIDQQMKQLDMSSQKAKKLSGVLQGG